MKLLDTLKKQLDALLPPPLMASPAPITVQATVGASRRSASRISKRALPHPQAYSHGLEKIYTLETVDVATVKVLEVTTQVASPSISTATLTESYQAEFDFGMPWRRWITPCFLKEPIHVLELSKQAMTALSIHGYSTIEELLGADQDVLMAVKGFGQGHIDELKVKLCEHLRGRSPQESTTVEWGAWLRSLVASLPMRNAKILLDSYKLGEVLSVNRSLQAELRRLNTVDKQEIVKMSFAALEENIPLILERLEAIVAALVAPWIRNRGGIASSEELSERLEQISADVNLLVPAWQFLTSLLKVEESPWECHLHRVAPHIYTVDEATATEYRDTVAIASTYLYSPNLSYPLEDIATWVAREQASRWSYSSIAQNCRILRYVPEWRVRRASCGRLILAERKI